MQPDKIPDGADWSFQVESERDPFIADSSHDTPSLQQPIAWTGSEFIAQHKNTGWYMGLFGCIALVCIVIFFISKDILSVIFIAIMGILFAIIASRKPRQLQFLIDNQGIHVGQRHYLFNEFKSFSLQKDGAIGYINLLPLRRLHPELSIYFAPEDAGRIFDALALHIPHEDHVEALVDKFIKKIRF